MAAHSTTPPGFPASSGVPADSTFDPSSLEQLLGHRLPSARWLGWRLRLLLAAALLGCVGLFLLIRHLDATPYLDAVWRATPQNKLELVSSGDPRLRTLEGQQLLGLAGSEGTVVMVDALALQRSPRWLVSDAQRERHARLQQTLGTLLAQPEVRLFFHDGTTVALQPRPRGIGGLGAVFWLLAGLALLLYLVALVVVLARPSMRNGTYAVMTLAQACNMLFVAVESLPGLGFAPGFAQTDLHARVALDLLTAGALVHAISLHPHKLPGHRRIAAAGWAVTSVLAALSLGNALPQLWWTVQGAAIAAGLVTVGLLSWSYRREPNPLAMVLRRFASVVLGTLVLLTAAVAAAAREPGLQLTIAAVGSVIWYVFLASLLVLVPFLSRSKQVMREFAMLAGISTVATSLDLLFLAVFSIGQFASLALSLFLSIGLYAGARQWILNQMLGNGMLTTERTFEQLYRIAREAEANPQRTCELLEQLLRDLFEPLEVARVNRPTRRSRVLGDGSAMLVPMPALLDGVEPACDAVVLRFARRGKRMFTLDDARLTDRVVEQLRRAVAFDRAIEQARSDERARIAQDLHDDIGARLLTLMYKAPDPEMEDYVRHTLQDLKTLTRGLAAASHRLSHAAAEWKTDISQRLQAAQCQLRWSFANDRDIVLSVVQWSALTRMLRELVSNAISHAHASVVQVDITFERGVFTLRVADDGVGRDPRRWSHGLGLGGVRKRVKLLGGEVHWRENQPRGICCAVLIPHLQGKTPPA